ncbi:MAG: M4 family metallopeptidase, partial [Actinomycetota bacterium]|nr:M4 family metallopeptidase [Actinomycetota bacterium]
GTLPLRARRLEAALAPPLTTVRRTVHDVGHGAASDLPGKLVWRDGDPPAPDAAVNEAAQGAGDTWAFYERVLGRDSIDGHGQTIVSCVHYERDFDNAFWDGGELVYGDGSGELFRVGALTKALEVIGHELTHGVTQNTAGLAYSRQPGALNEHVSDVFGSLVKQYTLGQSAEQADWLIGEGTLVPSLGRALRSMSAPGTAYDGDGQPAHMDDYRDLPDDGDPSNDNGGVHINSGIPNHAFYLAATAIGGDAWDTAGRVWYGALTQQLRADSVFADEARATIAIAGTRYSSTEQDAVAQAWSAVGVAP